MAPILSSSCKRAVRELRVASPEDPVGTKVFAKLSFHCCVHIDIGKQSEALALQRLGYSRHRLIEGAV